MPSKARKRVSQKKVHANPNIKIPRAALLLLLPIPTSATSHPPLHEHAPSPALLPEIPKLDAFPSYFLGLLDDGFDPFLLLVAHLAVFLDRCWTHETAAGALRVPQSRDASL